MGNWPVTLGLGKAKQLEQANVAPTNVHLVPAAGQLGRVRIGVVVVVQFFASDQDAPGRNIAGIISALEVAVTQVMANAIDYPGRPYRNPHHLHRPDPDPVNAEQRQVEHRHQHDTQHFVSAIDVALDPVFRGALTVTLESFRRGRLGVELRALQQHLANTQNHRAVGVFLGFTLGVMFTVDGGPLLGILRSGHPQPETEKMPEHRMQIQGVMSRMAMQIERNADDGDMGEHQGDCNQLPYREVKETVKPHKLSSRIHQLRKAILRGEIRKHSKGTYNNNSSAQLYASTTPFGGFFVTVYTYGPETRLPVEASCPNYPK